MTDAGSHITLNQADVAAVLGQLRDEVRARRVAQGQIELSPLERELQHSLDEIELYRVVSAHWPLVGGTIRETVVALVNKLVRRYLRWYINPIVEQQNTYNDAVARTLRLLADAYVDLSEQIVENKEQRAENQEAKNQEVRIENKEQRAENKESSRGYQPASSTENQAQGNNFSILNSQFSILNLQSLVHERAAAELPARFPDLELRAATARLGMREQITAHWPLGGATARERAVALVNKLVRRYLRWYINPIVEQQSAANAAIEAGLLALIRVDAERRAQVAALRASDKMKG